MATSLPCDSGEFLHPSHQTDIKGNTTACVDLLVKPLPGVGMPEVAGRLWDGIEAQAFTVLTSEPSGRVAGGSMKMQGRPTPSAL